MKKLSQYLFLMTVGLSITNQNIHAENDFTFGSGELPLATKEELGGSNDFQFKVEAPSPRMDTPVTMAIMGGDSASLPPMTSAPSLAVMGELSSSRPPAGLTGYEAQAVEDFVDKLPEDEQKEIKESSKSSIVKTVAKIGFPVLLVAAIFYLAKTGRLDKLGEKIPSLKPVIEKIVAFSKNIPSLGDVWKKVSGVFGKKVVDASAVTNEASALAASGLKSSPGLISSIGNKLSGWGANVMKWGKDAYGKTQSSAVGKLATNMAGTVALNKGLGAAVDMASAGSENLLNLPE